MIVDRVYKISIFGDFSDILPTAENMMYFLEQLKDDGLVPSVFNELKIENGNPAPQNFQRIALLSNDGFERIPIASERIDYEIRTTEDIQRSEEWFENAREKIVRVFGVIFNHFNKQASRLALNAENLMIDLTHEEVVAFYDRFPNPISIYDKTKLSDFATSLMIRDDIDVGDKNETINVITQIERTDLKKNVDNQTIDSEGFIIRGDINTVAENAIQRFDINNIGTFIDVVTPLWGSIIRELS